MNDDEAVDFFPCFLIPLPSHDSTIITPSPFPFPFVDEFTYCNQELYVQYQKSTTPLMMSHVRFETPHRANFYHGFRDRQSSEFGDTSRDVFYVTWGALGNVITASILPLDATQR